MRQLAIIAILGVMIVTFQNFSNVPLAALRPQLSMASARAVSPTDGRADMRSLAPPRPDETESEETPIVAPQAGHDLATVGQDWLARQSNALTGGAEQKLLDKMNKKMGRWVNGEEKSKPRSPASDIKAPRTDGDTPVSVRPRNIHFSRVNRMDMDLVGDTHLSCQFKGNSMQWDLTRNVIGDVDVNLRHDSKDSANSLLLKYNW